MYELTQTLDRDSDPKVDTTGEIDGGREGEDRRLSA